MDEIKEYIEKFLSDNIIQYHIDKKDKWIKYLYEKVNEQQEELIEAYRKRGHMFSAGEKEWIDKRIDELKH